MKEKFKNLKSYIKKKFEDIKEKFEGLSKKKLLLILLGIIAIILIICSIIFRKSTPKIKMEDARVLLGDYKGIELTLEDTTVTDDDIQEMAEYSISYYNQTADKEKLSLDTLTDKQVMDAFDMDGVEDFYAYIRQYLENSNEDSKHTNAYNKICEYLLETCTVDPFPDYELSLRLNKYMKNLEESCKSYYDTTLSEYCKNMNMTESEYKEKLSENLVRELKLELIFIAIGDAENIQYDEESFQSYMKDLITNHGYDSEEDIYEEYDEEDIKRTHRIECIVDWLIDKADITYVQLETEEDSKTDR